jgi:membrane AbrB-like protein
MSCIPGGMNDIPIISADMGADAPKVAVMQFIRMAAGIGLFPSLISIVAKRQNKKTNDAQLNTSESIPERAKSQEYTTIVFIQTIAVASVFGIIGKLLNIPAGILVFSMIGVGFFKLRFNKACMPMWAKRLAQVLSGAYIGCCISYSDVKELKYLIVPALLLLLGYFATCIFGGKLLSKYFNMSIKEAMLAATPAGASDMALISSDLGVHSNDLNVLQIIRLVVVVSVFPQIINIIVKLVG